MASATRRCCSPAGAGGSREATAALDELPVEVLAACEAALVRSLDREELLRALASAISVLQQESEGAAELADAVPQLQALSSGSQPSR